MKTIKSINFQVWVPLVVVVVGLRGQAKESQVISAGTEVAPVSCEVINKAIQALPIEGGRVTLGKGFFECAYPVVIDKSNVEVVGAGIEQTILRSKAQNPAPVLVVGKMEAALRENPKYGPQWYPVELIKQVRVSHLTVDGNRENQPSPHEFECFDWATNKATTCYGDGGKHIRNNGITIRHAEGVEIVDVLARNCLSGGMTIEKKSARVHVNGFYSFNNYFDGLAGYETHSSTLENVILAKNVFSGVSIDLDWGPTEAGQGPNVFRNLLVLQNGDNGIFSANVGGTIFENVVVAGNKNLGIYFDGRRVLKDEKQKARDRGETINLNDPASWNIIPHTCDHQFIKNALVIGNGGAGVFINHICEDVVFKQVTVVVPKPDQCIWDPFQAGWNREDSQGLKCLSSGGTLVNELLDRLGVAPKIDKATLEKAMMALKLLQ